MIKNLNRNKYNFILQASEGIYLFEAYCLKGISEQKAKRDKRLELFKIYDRKKIGIIGKLVKAV